MADLLQPLLKSIATVSLSGPLPEKLEAAAAAGFEAVEIFENDLLTFDGSPEDVRRIADGLGLSVVLFQPFRDFEAMPDPQRARNLDRAERKFDVMQALGTDLVLVCSNVQAAAIDDAARAAADLREMAERAAKRGLRVGYEALAWGRHVKRWRDAWRIVQDADHPALGLIVDSFHTLSLGDDPAGIAEVPGERIFFVQLADAPKLAMDVLSWSRHFRNFPYQGDLDVAGFTRAVLASGYRGPLSLEIFNDEFRSAPARPTARDGLRSLVLVEAEAGGPALPPPARFDGVEFLEFALDEDAARRLGEMLRGLGFRYAGRHRSKSVDLYRQGRINVVLNTEQDSAAAEHFQLHGPSVCAMALRVDDVNAALRAPDGTLIYLIAPSGEGPVFYADDFTIFPAGETAEGPLAAIDHVALAVPFGRMEAFALFWRAVFGLEPEQLFELPDPYGLVRSRTMVSRDRTLRLPLNSSESRQTATGRFLTTVSGAGVHHIAMATPDIVAAVERVALLGGKLLPVPENYYEDLGARLGLDDDRLESLRRHSLLYDRDDSGEYLQAYTTSFDDRFFFEIVQRVGGYEQYGAANAGVRLAAQAQAQRRSSSVQSYS